MKDDIFSSIKRQYFLTIIYTALGFLIINFGSWTIVCLIALVCGRLASTSFFWFSGTLFAGVLLFFFLLRYKCRIEVSEPRKTKPYIIRLDFSDCTLIKDELVQRLSAQNLPTGGFCSHVKGKRNILLLIYQMPAFSKKECAKIREKNTRAARMLVGLKTEMSIAEVKNSCRINILLLDEIAEEAYDQISVNAVYGMRYAEAVLNVYIDMKALTLYIPSYISLWNGGASKYCYCVKTLFHLLPYA